MDQYKLIKFLAHWIVNTLVLLIFSALFPNNIVLGNAAITKPMSSVLVGFILAILILLIPRAAKNLQLKIKDEKVQAVIYLVFNLVALWILKRLADFTGIGISSILWVLILATFVSLIQVSVEKYSTQLLKKSKVN